MKQQSKVCELILNNLGDKLRKPGAPFWRMVMKVLFAIGFSVIAIGFAILLIDWATWCVAVMLITIGLAKLVFFGWASKMLFRQQD